MKVTVTVCDRCKHEGKEPELGQATTQYEVRRGDKRGRVDLCEGHGAAIEELLALQSTEGVRPARKATSARGGTRTVRTLEEIEKLKGEKSKDGE